MRQGRLNALRCDDPMHEQERLPPMMHHLRPIAVGLSRAQSRSGVGNHRQQIASHRVFARVEGGLAVPPSKVDRDLRARYQQPQRARKSRSSKTRRYGSPRRFDWPLASEPPALMRCLRLDALPARRVGCFATLRVELRPLPPPDAPLPFLPRAPLPLLRSPPPRDFCLLVPPPRRLPVFPPRD